MRKLVGDQQLQPVVEVGQCEMIDRRPRVERDPVRRPEWDEAVRHIEMVGQDDIDRTARTFEELCGEFAVRPLSQVSRSSAQRFEMLREGDAEVLRLERSPHVVRGDLRRCPHTQQYADQQCHEETRRGTGHGARVRHLAGSLKSRRTMGYTKAPAKGRLFPRKARWPRRVPPAPPSGSRGALTIFVSLHRMCRPRIRAASLSSPGRPAAERGRTLAHPQTTSTARRRSADENNASQGTSEMKFDSHRDQDRS